MSQLIKGERVTEMGIKSIAEGLGSAFLVEQMPSILLCSGKVPEGYSSLDVFHQKDDLTSFEEAKLYGHNAVHALLGYLCRLAGFEYMEQAAGNDIMEIGRRAFIEESGAALVAAYGACGDPLFTEAGYEAYAKDLMQRMTNPNLHDQVDRIIRDPERKLGWDDRLVGTMRRIREQGFQYKLIALGAAAAIIYWQPGMGSDGVIDFLQTHWDQRGADAQDLSTQIYRAHLVLREWTKSDNLWRTMETNCY